jgi:hypothetical protein
MHSVKNPDRWTQLITAPAGVTPIVLGALVAATWALGVDGTAGTLVAIALMLYVAGLVATAVHEVGHAAGSWMVGFRVILLGIGPLRLQRHASGYRVVPNRDWQTTAVQVSVPRADTRLGIRWRKAVVVAAGPLASLATAVAAYALYAAGAYGAVTLAGVRAGAFTTTEYLASIFLLLFAFVSAGCFLSALPGREGGTPSDGSYLWLLWRGGPELERLLANDLLTAAITEGTRPREWPVEWVRAATSIADGTAEEATGCLLAYYHAIDRGDADEAGAVLERSQRIAAEIPLMTGGVAAEAAFFQARYRRDAEAARTLLAQVGHSPLEHDTRLRAEAALLLLEGRAADAAERAREAITALGDAWSATAGICRMERESLELIVSEAGGAVGTAGRLQAPAAPLGRLVAG